MVRLKYIYLKFRAVHTTMVVSSQLNSATTGLKYWIGHSFFLITGSSQDSSTSLDSAEGIGVKPSVLAPIQNIDN